LIDILTYLAVEENKDTCRTASLTCPNGSLIPNRKMKVLMVPPEHRNKIEPVLHTLRSISP
jgi:hypothetical protein